MTLLSHGVQNHARNDGRQGQVRRPREEGTARHANGNGTFAGSRLHITRIMYEGMSTNARVGFAIYQAQHQVQQLLQQVAALHGEKSGLERNLQVCSLHGFV